MILRVLICIFLAVPIFAQDGARINRHKFYDAKYDLEDAQKIKRRRLTTDVDSTGIKIQAWGNECYMKINLLDRMLVNVSMYDYRIINGSPAVKYGNTKYQFRMYVNKSGNFEFDAIIRRKSVSGKHEFHFNIESKGMKFFYQDPVVFARNKGWLAPDSVLGSYAVYHMTKKNNARRINGADTTYENYGTGKAFHIYRPRVWDSAGDTVWGYIDIDVKTGLMIIGVDSTWAANATYPVTIDPTVGKTSAGSSNYVFGTSVRYASITMTEAASSLDSITAYLTGYQDIVAYHAIYSDTGTSKTFPYTLVEEETTGLATDISGWAGGAWHSLPMAGTTSLTNGDEYFLAVGAWSGTSGIRVFGDFTTGTDSSRFIDGGQTSFTDPSTAGEELDDDDIGLSIYATYSTGGGSPAPSTRRRKVLLRGNR